MRYNGETDRQTDRCIDRESPRFPPTNLVGIRRLEVGKREQGLAEEARSGWAERRARACAHAARGSPHTRTPAHTHTHSRTRVRAQALSHVVGHTKDPRRRRPRTQSSSIIRNRARETQSSARQSSARKPHGKRHTESGCDRTIQPIGCCRMPQEQARPRVSRNRIGGRAWGPHRWDRAHALAPVSPLIP